MVGLKTDHQFEAQNKTNKQNANKSLRKPKAISSKQNVKNECEMENVEKLSVQTHLYVNIRVFTLHVYTYVSI